VKRLHLAGLVFAVVERLEMRLTNQGGGDRFDVPDVEEDRDKSMTL